MNDFRLISAILKGVWLLDKEWANANLPVWSSVLEGKPMNFGEAQQRKPEARVAVIGGASAGPHAATLVTPSYFSGFDKAPEGSFAKIDLIGPIMKYGYCSDGSYELTQIVKEAKANKNIRGLFIECDCPGGQVMGTSSLGDAVYNFGKPTLTFINDGMMCSGGTWIGTSADEVYASHDLVTIGGVGVYQTIQDHSDRLKAMGIKVIERYAKQSSDKNKTYRDALAGDFELLDGELAHIATTFSNKMLVNRGARLKGEPEGWNKGKDGSASWAMSVGLIDGICTYEEAVARLEEMDGGKPSKRAEAGPYVNTHNPDLNIEMKFPKLFALAGKEAATPEELTAVNAELAEAGITGVAVFNEGVVTDAAAVSAERDTLKASNTTLTTELNSEKGKVANLTTENDQLKAQIAKSPAAAAPVVSGTDPVTEQTEEQKQAATIAGFAHNQYAKSLLRY